MTQIFQCPLTGLEASLTNDINGSTFFYETPVTGPVKITGTALDTVNTLSPEDKNVLASYIRNKNIDGEDLTVTANLVANLKNLSIPRTFNDKTQWFLKHLYAHGGKEYESFNIDSSQDFTLAYSNPEEFKRIIPAMNEDSWIVIENSTPTKQGIFYKIRLSKTGIDFVEKALPNYPLIQLVNENVETGNGETDDRINAAKRLFLSPDSGLNEKRSACESLIFIMEPLREELSLTFEGDTEYFFRITNEFNIRHNKERTKRIEHVEQLEWVFYSLLNTVIAYFKLKRKGN